MVGGDWCAIRWDGMRCSFICKMHTRHVQSKIGSVYLFILFILFFLFIYLFIYRMQMHTWPYTIIYKNVYLYVFSSLNLIDRSWGSQLFDIFGMGFTLGVVTNLRLTLLQHGDAQVIYSSPIMKALWSGTRAIIRYNFLPTGITGHISTSQLDSLDAQVGTLMPMGGSMHQIKADLLRSLWRCLTPGGSPKLYIETADSCHFDATSLEMGSKRPIKFCRNLWEKNTERTWAQKMRQKSDRTNSRETDLGALLLSQVSKPGVIHLSSCSAWRRPGSLDELLWHHQS
jgi:hypothetical protein